MPEPFESTKATPSRMLRNPSVTMNGFIRNAVTKTPWDMPMSAPSPSATGSAIHDGSPPPS